MGALVLGKSESGKGGSRSSATLAALESNLLLIERRVEKIRGEHFTHRPLPVLVTGAEVRREGLADLDRLMPPEEQAASEELLKLLGLIPARASLRAIQSAVFGEQVAGFYDPRTKRLALVKDTGASDESIGEITLAHELTHALDDQRFGIRDEVPGTDDRSLAYTALVEGDATAVMTRYAASYMSGVNLLGALFAGSASASSPPLPDYIQAQLEFPYLEGERFVQTLNRYARGWKLVNYAFRFRPPVSSAQILHPLLYAQNRGKPRPLRLHVGSLLGKRWRRATAGALGEFDTRQLLRRGLPVERANTIAEAWRGGTYELWRNGPLPSANCPGPCRARDVLVLAWRTPAGSDAQDLGNGLAAFMTTGIGGRARGQGVWTLPGGAAALETRGPVTVLALAPTIARASLVAAVAAR